MEKICRSFPVRGLPLGWGVAVRKMTLLLQPRNTQDTRHFTPVGLRYGVCAFPLCRREKTQQRGYAYALRPQACVRWKEDAHRNQWRYHWTLSMLMRTDPSWRWESRTQRHCTRSERMPPRHQLPWHVVVACWLHDCRPSLLTKAWEAFCVRTASGCVQTGPWHAMAGEALDPPGWSPEELELWEAQFHSLVRRKLTPFPMEDSRSH